MPLSGIDCLMVQPEAGGYIDCAITGYPKKKQIEIKQGNNKRVRMF
jgi:hypothetical protein